MFQIRAIVCRRESATTRKGRRSARSLIPWIPLASRWPPRRDGASEGRGEMLHESFRAAVPGGANCNISPDARRLRRSGGKLESAVPAART